MRFRCDALDAINFLLADVRGALGPFLNVFLITQQGWSQSAVGLVTTVSGLLGIVAQVPAGALIDRTHAKRGLLGAALTILAAATSGIFAFPDFCPLVMRKNGGASRSCFWGSLSCRCGPDSIPCRTTPPG